MEFDRNKQSLLLDGKRYTKADVLALCGRDCQPQSMQHADPFLRTLFLFLAEWFDESPTLQVQTSGSTGTPKILSVRKDRMMESARMTCEFLQLQAGDAALLCMPLQYIAGKMMVVRALVAGLNLIVRTPSGHPLADVQTPLRFAAMVPLQVYNTLQVPAEKERLCRTDILIIGGGAVEAGWEAEIRRLPGEVYSTYGMTETLSHIALRRLNGRHASPHYKPFPSVRLSLSAEGTLAIDAPLVCEERLITNDVAELHPDGTFTILGRKDNIINSGGIKIQAEEVEEILRPVIPVPFAITSTPDSKLGEAVVLLIEETKELEEIKQKIPLLLTKYRQPRQIRVVNAIPLTGTGKIDRAACRKL